MKVNYCRICHSDLSMINNEWGMTPFPIVPGREVIGEIVAVGSEVKNLKPKDWVGHGWNSGTCMPCKQCKEGSHHLCKSGRTTIDGHCGEFTDYVRCHWFSAILLPEGINVQKTGPLHWGCITVFSSIYLAGVNPTEKNWVIGMAGLGHMALKFLNKWGCEVIAFSSNPDKKVQILAMGATKVINSRDPKELESIAGTLNFVLNTTNVSLDWNSYLMCLAPRSRIHNIAAVFEPMAIPAFTLLAGEKTVGSSTTGSPALIRTMLELCVRHNIYPMVEEFPLDKVNEALEHLAKGKARYRIVLKV